MSPEKFSFVFVEPLNCGNMGCSLRRKNIINALETMKHTSQSEKSLMRL